MIDRLNKLGKDGWELVALRVVPSKYLVVYEKTNQVDLAKWSLLIAKRILDIVDIDYYSAKEIVNGFKVNELWQIGEARIHDVRQAGLKIHKLARESGSEIKKTALRVVGQAVGSGHMREHANYTCNALY
ncbi:MAG TPA: hypothetical protein VFC60_01585 [Tissierellaceae bacterium]|nr:hypothetical protein [Tissierellaceae bacterium]